MHTKLANLDSRWDNYCNKLIILIDRDNDDFPSEEDINKLVKYTEKAFGNSPFMQHAMDRVFNVRRKWKNKNKKRNSRNKEIPMGKEKVNLNEDIKEAVQEVITKIASENNIKLADVVRIHLDDECGTIHFIGAE